uniref:Uncharacterized protein n=1 Tax=Haptolina brevifila TaxID=156173 RepID=A0A7S2IHD4_9EUKA|mmetsp:Transcript_65865/g.130566  ORF Transcript_65865/g.130566 Transcript_65865/m.130566 type:complete len:219 (+) Transcript_65865:34-690(+)|eukprot:CAMPEP_0174722110 /NCGR_PEP_ID=MMETSP1094-20130205/37623_1 /TAXON_ID=156173 /ORGANISM="Chrysochromulina brevifilum, Strain UTEX LB 985" /LENGTH=218 /DNA_ID=CAMNT_0015922901 /DNA_START=32 /DNA_END=688 /DNA_ORIENTATION=+
MKRIAFLAVALLAATSGALVIPVRTPVSRRCPAPYASAAREDKKNMPAEESTVPAEPIDPRKAVEEMGSLMKQIQTMNENRKNWSPDEMTMRRREVVNTYVRVFAPALAFSGTQLALTFVSIFIVYGALSVSGRGYNDVLALSEGIAPLHNAIEGIGPGYGNGAVGFVIVEALGPLLLPVALALTPRSTIALQEKLNSWDLDGDGLNIRIEKVLRETS